MENNIEARVKELVTDFKLDEALDMLIAQAQTQNQRKQNTLLVLKGKLALLEEQNLSGMLDPSDLARQKATIAHQILDIADGSPLDLGMTIPQPEPQAFVQKTVNAPAALGATWPKYLMLAVLLTLAVLAGVFISNNFGDKKANEADQPRPSQPKQEPSTTADNNDTAPVQPSDAPLKLLNFPNVKRPFNFLDFVYEFAWADVEWVSDNEIRLKIRCYLTCKSNLGNCYCGAVRIYADGKPFAPAEQSNLAGWVAHEATITDDLAFVLPANAKDYQIELSRDKSTWKRPFKILQ
jgi:Effector-associated domain 11